MIVNSKIALTGASGFVGQKLQEAFSNVVTISRNDTEAEIEHKLKGVDVVINLAGAPIVKRWSEAYKKVLYSSRIESTKKLVSAINSSDVSYFISTSAIGIYPNDTKCDESCKTYADDFLAQLCQDWETEALRCNKPTAILRFGVVLDVIASSFLSEVVLYFRDYIYTRLGINKNTILLLLWTIPIFVSFYISYLGFNSTPQFHL